MTVHIALLRAVNLGGKTSLAMADLRAMAAEMGLTDARTLLQSGNMVFKSDESQSALETLLESQTATMLGLKTKYVLRTASQWDALISANPFPDEARTAPAKLQVVLLKAAPPASWSKSLIDWNTGPERVEVIGRALYIVYPGGIGRSKLNAAPAWRKLDTVGTARNWNTVVKLRDLAASVQG